MEVNSMGLQHEWHNSGGEGRDTCQQHTTNKDQLRVESHQFSATAPAFGASVRGDPV